MNKSEMTAKAAWPKRVAKPAQRTPGDVGIRRYRSGEASARGGSGSVTRGGTESARHSARSTESARKDVQLIKKTGTIAGTAKRSMKHKPQMIVDISLN